MDKKSSTLLLPFIAELGQLDVLAVRQKGEDAWTI